MIRIIKLIAFFLLIGRFTYADMYTYEYIPPIADGERALTFKFHIDNFPLINSSMKLRVYYSNNKIQLVSPYPNSNCPFGLANIFLASTETQREWNSAKRMIWFQSRLRSASKSIFSILDSYRNLALRSRLSMLQFRRSSHSASISILISSSAES